jgi:hypothetical protein
MTHGIYQNLFLLLPSHRAVGSWVEVDDKFSHVMSFHFIFLKTGSCYVVQADLKLVILLTQPSEYSPVILDTLLGKMCYQKKMCYLY